MSAPTPDSLAGLSDTLATLSRWLDHAVARKLAQEARAEARFHRARRARRRRWRARRQRLAGLAGLSGRAVGRRR